MHFLPPDAKGLDGVRAFDVEALATQLAEAHARYFVITLGQNSGYFNAPNAAYDRIAGFRPGERCSTRDLPLALSDALRARGIRLMLYLPSQPPNEDAQAQRAFGLPEGKKDQPLTVDAARKWAEVIREWSDRYGDRVSGWWFDGGYDHVRFDGQIAAIYAAAARHGQPGVDRHVQPGRDARAPHARRRLHGRRAQRAVRRRAGVPLRGRGAVACAHLSRQQLGTAGHALPDGSLGGLGEGGRCGEAGR